MSSQALVIRITGDPSQFRQAMAEVSGIATKAASDIERSGARISSFGDKLTAGITLPVVGLAAAAVKAAVDLDSLQRGLSATMKSADKAAEEMTKLREVARLPGLGLQEAVQGSIRLQTLGVSADKSRVIMRELGNALSIVGGSKADFGEVIRQLSQLAATGKVTKENLDPIIERIPQIASIIREKFGPEALGDPAKVFKQLGIDSAKFIDIITGELSKLERATGGPKAALENLQDTIKESAARIGEKLLPSVKAAIPEIEKLAMGAADAVDWFTKLPEPIKNTAYALGALTLAAGPTLSLFGRLKTAAEAVRDALKWVGGGFAVAGGGSAALGAGIVGSAIAATAQVMKLREQLDALPSSAANADIRKHLNAGKTNEEIQALGFSMEQISAAMRGFVPVVGNAGGTVAQLTAMLAGGTKAAAEHGEEFKKTGEKVKSAFQAMTPTTAMLALKERMNQIEETYNQTISRGADIMREYGAATAATAIQRAASIQNLRNIMRDMGLAELEAAPSIDFGHPDFKSIPKPQMELPGGDFEAFKKASQNIGELGMQTKEQFEAMKRASKSARSEISRQVSTIVTDFSRGVARMILDGGKFRDVMKGIGNQIAESLLRTVIEKGINAVIGALGNLITKVFDVGGAFSKVFGGGVANASGTIFSAAGGSGGGPALGPGSSGGAMAGGAVSGVMGAVTMVSGVISAISGIIGNFQMARQEGTLNAIEKEVRYSQIHLGHLLDKANEYWPKLADIWGSLIRMEQRSMDVAAAGVGGESMVVNFYGPIGAGVDKDSLKSAMYEVVKEFKRKGIN